ncbi:glycosyltransferase family 2 protein [Haloarcula salina]|uniref:Glycosyltransferase family 2 protein n=1 Tax=Haloarcula salina TaxID=1429914 RepID=A0AA41KLA9_9EURY|nr:glycosyltransferase family 2 protein [Haloarcula salina]MBV0902724.1 glycosyltransferase family 2 protein [Haloarcula salina]
MSDTVSDPPLVSVVITTYNRPECLERAIQTVSAQTYSPVEVLVVDDRSRVPASDTVRKLSPDVAGLRCIRHDENRGANAARNTGVAEANGSYVAFLDDDDRWAPDKLQRQVAAFERTDGDVGLVFTGRKHVGDGDVTERKMPDSIEGDVTKQLLCRNVVGTQSSIMVRTEIAREVRFDEEIKRWADLEWYIRVSQVCDFHAVSEPLVIYTFDAGNRISDDFDRLQTTVNQFIEKYSGLAREYGILFERKMRGWAYHRVAQSCVYAGNYAGARHYSRRAIATYPFEPSFYVYAFAASGGRLTHRTAQTVRTALSRMPLPSA